MLFSLQTLSPILVLDLYSIPLLSRLPLSLLLLSRLPLSLLLLLTTALLHELPASYFSASTAPHDNHFHPGALQYTSRH